ncbi:DNA internalization-related competence protein ComEC/Rec2, partial [candidate division CSSED10-310 bacterium]
MTDYLFLPTIFLITGMLAGGTLPFLGFIPCYAGCCLFVFAFISLLLNKNSSDRSYLSLVCTFFFLLGFQLLQFSLWTSPQNDISLYSGRYQTLLRGTISSDIETKPETVTVVLTRIQVISENKAIPLDGKVKVSVAYKDPGELALLVSRLNHGNRIEFQAQLGSFNNCRNLTYFDAKTYYATQGIKARAYISKVQNIKVLSVPTRSPLSQWMQNYRTSLKNVLNEWATANPYNHEHKKVSSFLQAILLGKRSELDQDIREEFKTTGLYHILAISGLHVGILAGLLYIPLLCLFRNKIRLRAAILILIIILYSFITEGQPSVLRATIMLVVHLLGTIFFRESRILNTLSLSAGILLCYQPLFLFQTGFQLTFLAVLSIYFLTEEVRLNLIPGLSKSLIGSIVAVSIAVQVGMAPVLAELFGLIPVLSFFPFLIILPLLIIILFFGFCLIVAALFSPFLASLFLYPLHYITLFLLAIIHQFASIPFNTVAIGMPSTVTMITYYLILFLMLCPRFRPPAFRVIRLVLVLIFLASFLLPIVRDKLNPTIELTFLDVGDGDSTFVRLPGGHTFLIDGGGTERNRFDTARHIIQPFFLKKGVRGLDGVMVTHAHADHIMGIINLLDRFPITKAYVQPRQNAPELYHQYIRTLRQNDIKTAYLIPPYEHPLMDINENNTSLILKVSYGSFSVLLTGDIEQEESDIMQWIEKQ